MNDKSQAHGDMGREQQAHSPEVGGSIKPSVTSTESYVGLSRPCEDIGEFSGPFLDHPQGLVTYFALLWSHCLESAGPLFMTTHERAPTLYHDFLHVQWDL